MSSAPDTATTLRPFLAAGDTLRTPLFAAIPAASRARLLDHARIERLPAGTTLFCEGETPREFYAIQRGMIDISCTYQGRHCTAVLMTAGDVFMPAAALSNEPYLVSACTLTATRLMIIDLEVVRQEAARTPEFALAIARLVSAHWRMALRIILDLKCRSASERLAAFLLRLHDTRPPGTNAQIPFAKRQLAARVGMQPESLSRTLQVLAGHGLHVRGREIMVTDRARIEAFCGPDPYPARSEDEFGVHAL